MEPDATTPLELNPNPPAAFQVMQEPQLAPIPADPLQSTAAHATTPATDSTPNPEED